MNHYKRERDKIEDNKCGMEIANNDIGMRNDKNNKTSMDKSLEGKQEWPPKKVEVKILTKEEKTQLITEQEYKPFLKE